MGVSGDKPESQVKFIQKYGLTYPMVPDRKKHIITEYGARAVLGLAAKRSTFLIDPQGRIAQVWADVRLGGHAEDVVSTIRRLAGRG